jgi:hypothetical protein
MEANAASQMARDSFRAAMIPAVDVLSAAFRGVRPPLTRPQLDACKSATCATPCPNERTPFVGLRP